MDVQITRCTRAAPVELTVRDTGQGIARDFLPGICSTAFGRPMRRRAGGMAAWGSAWRWCARSPSFMAAPSRRAVRASIAARHSRCRLPRASGRMTVLAPSVGPNTLTGIAVPVVDDNADGREMLDTALRAYGARVTWPPAPAKPSLSSSASSSLMCSSRTSACPTPMDTS